MINYH